MASAQVGFALPGSPLPRAIGHGTQVAVAAKDAEGQQFRQTAAAPAQTSAVGLPIAAALAAVAAQARRRGSRRAPRAGAVCALRAVDAPAHVSAPAAETAWRQFGSDWAVHKFGGASLETAELYKTCGDLLRSEAAVGGGTGGRMPTAAIVSAAGGMTDQLVAIVTTSVEDLDAAKEKLEAAAARQIGMVLELVPDQPELTDPVRANIEKDKIGVMAMLTAVSLMRGVPPQVLEQVAGLGEVWSAQTLMTYLKSTGSEAAWVDAREVLIVPDAGAGSGLGEKGMALDTIVPFWDESADRLSSWWSKAIGVSGPDSAAPFLIITGFVCSTPSGRPTTLKRSGSDYSATIFAKVLGASSVTMWKNVDGVYTADPRRVPAAFPIKSMTFDEAMELAYFGGQVLHPSAMIPCIEKRIPVLVRNVFNPSHPGTRVYGRGDDWLRWPDQTDDDDDDDFPVKAITSIEKVALVTLSGASFLGTPGVGRRMMEALCNAGVNVILTSQGSSEHSITVAVDERDEQPALASVRQAFALELSQELEIRAASRGGVSILAVIGENMKRRTGISGRFFNSLGRAKVNIVAIAQGSSERNISAVVSREDLSRALRASHAGFTLSDMTMAIGIIGSGQVGTELMRQISSFTKSGERNRNLPALVDSKRLNIEVRAICDERMMLLADRGLPLDVICEGEHACGSVSSGGIFDIAEWNKSVSERGTGIQELLQEKNAANEFTLGETDLLSLEDFMDIKRIPHKVLIDCTASKEVASMYPRWLQRGLHVISPNKRGGSGPMTLHSAIMEATGPSKAQWCYESTVGGQMPVISVIRDILLTGDKVTRVEGIFSGTVSYILGEMARNPDRTLSEAVQEARRRGLTEPDPWEDVSGMDTARKVLILARELGVEMELSDVKVESLLPGSLVSESPGDAESLIAALKAEVDEAMTIRASEATSRGERLCYVGEVDAEAGTASVRLRSCPVDDPLSTVREAETVVSFITRRYPAGTPLVVRGPGAGAVVTASGVFADLLRLSKTLGS